MEIYAIQFATCNLANDVDPISPQPMIDHVKIMPHEIQNIQNFMLWHDSRRLPQVRYRVVYDVIVMHFLLLPANVQFPENNTKLDNSHCKVWGCTLVIPNEENT